VLFQPVSELSHYHLPKYKISCSTRHKRPIFFEGVLSFFQNAYLA